jgi:hypothetical protein
MTSTTARGKVGRALPYFLTMFPLTIKPDSFDYGPWAEIPYSSVVAAGIGVRTRGVAVEHRALMIRCRLPGNAKDSLIRFGLQHGAAGQQFESNFHAHVADRWKGEDGMFAMRKKLGFSNRGVFVTLAIIILVALGIAAGLVVPHLSAAGSSTPAVR